MFTHLYSNSFGDILSVTGNVSLGNVSIQGNTTNTGYMIVSGQTTLVNASVTGNFAAGNVSVQSLTTGPLWATDSLVVVGNTSLNNVSASELTVIGRSWMGPTSFANASITGTFAVAGNTSLQNVSISGNTTQGYLSVVGATSLANASISGTLAVAGNVSINNVSCTGLTVTGNSSLNGLSKVGKWYMYNTNNNSGDCLGTVYSTTNQSFALYQFSTGDTTNGLTVLNSNREIRFNILDVPKMVLTNTGTFRIGPNTYANSVMSITGIDTTYRDGIAIYAPPAINGMAFMVFINSTGTKIGWIDNISGTSVTYSSLSDRRMKTNIRPMNSMLEKMMNLKPSVYNWASNTETESVGFIAQEVYEVLPEMRMKPPYASDNLDEPTDDQGHPVYYGLDYGKFTPYIVKAFQELKQDYDAKLAALEARLSALENA